MMKNQTKLDRLQEISAFCISEYGHRHSKEIYNFMEKYGIGKNAFHRLMDAAGRHEAVHRLYGHHWLYNFPLRTPKNYKDFLEALFSDAFTNQGLPVAPGEILKKVGVLPRFKSMTRNWNFVNGFRTLFATLVIYNSTKLLQAAIKEEISIDSFKDFANIVGVGILDLAVACSHFNPYLVIGAALQIAAGIKALMNDSAVMYFSMINNRLTIEFSIESLSIEKSLDNLSIERSLDELPSIETSLDRLSIKNSLTKLGL